MFFMKRKTTQVIQIESVVGGKEKSAIGRFMVKVGTHSLVVSARVLAPLLKKCEFSIDREAAEDMMKNFAYIHDISVDEYVLLNELRHIAGN